jgi:hypothetical protein
MSRDWRLPLDRLRALSGKQVCSRILFELFDFEIHPEFPQFRYDPVWGDENIEFSVFKLHSGFVPSFTAGRET